MASVTPILLAGEALLHALQYERGCAALFLDSRGKIFKERLARRRAETDTAAANCLDAIKRAEQAATLPTLSKARLADLRRRIGAMSGLRGDIDKLATSYTGALNAFTFELNMPLLDTIMIVAHEHKALNSALISAFAYFLQWKERIGLERALGSRGFYSFAFRNPEFWDRMAALSAETRTYLDGFIGLAAPSQIEIVRDVLASREMGALDEVHAQLKEASAPAHFEKFDAEEWFDLVSRVLDQLHVAGQRMIAGLAGASAPEAADTTPPAFPTHIAPGAERVRPYLRSLPLFAGIDDADLAELLTHAQIRDYPRGKLLFLQGEQTQRMYVIIRGWVKLYNGTESGDETILQMLTSGDTLLEAAVFLNTESPVSAQVIDDATLLSIPAPVIRQRVNRNNTLAVSMLNNISLRSQTLIYQIEQNRLKDARARVGWFLLKLSLAQGSEDGRIRLPYDKSIIASYLDMRPETFSRVLKKMRDEGLDVHNDEITLPNLKILCEYCDSYVARDCKRAGTHECPSKERLGAA